MDRPTLDAPASDWLVYADSLQVGGDPRGELISLVHGADPAARDAFVHKHAEALLGSAAKSYRQNAYRLSWKHCFIDRAEVRVADGDHGEHWVKVILEAPASELLREIAIVGVTHGRNKVDLSAAIGGLAKAKWPASCASLALVDEHATISEMQISTEFGIDENLVAFGDLASIWKLPVTHIKIACADSQFVKIAPVDGSRIKSFVLHTLRYGDGWDGGANGISTALGEARWPVLEELELRLAETFSANIPFERKAYNPTYTEEMERVADRLDEADEGEAEPVNYSEIEPLLAKAAKAPLRRLALTSAESTSSLLQVLRRTGVAPTLRVLDFSDCGMGQSDVQFMRDNAQLFASLTQLVLERTRITDEDVKELQGLGPAILHSHLAGAPTYRYIVGSE